MSRDPLTDASSRTPRIPKSMRDDALILTLLILLLAVALLAAPQIAQFRALPPSAYVDSTIPPTLAPTATRAVPQIENVKIQNFAYSPASLTIPLGTTVKWTQLDKAVPHTVSAGSPAQPQPQSPFNSGTLTADGTSTYQFTFQQPGIFPYYCTFHTEMTGAVVVTDAQGRVPTSAPQAANATATPYTAPPPANVQVIATGLINPRGFTIGPDGAFYVAEAGTVPKTISATVTISATNVPSPAPRGTVNPICESQLPSYDKQAAGCPGAQGPQVSNKARISRIDANGTRTTIAENLPTVIGPFNDVFGTNSVAFVGKDLYIAIAAGATRGHPDFPTGIYRVNGNGTTTLVANLEEFQKQNPPKFIPPDYNYSLPYDIAQANGKLYVTDGNAAVVFEVDVSKPLGSNIQRIIDLSPTHDVLTGITADADGTIYFTDFTPAPYPVGGAQIFKWSAQNGLSVVTNGLSIATGIALSPDGTFYASEFATDTGKPPYIIPPGRVVQVNANGEIKTIATPLVYPTSLRWIDGALYVTNYGVNAVDGEPGNGAIYRVVIKK